MANNKLILRNTISPWVTPFNDIVKNSVLSWDDVDNNFIYLKGELIYSGETIGDDLILHKINGNDITIDLSSFSGGTGGTSTYLTGGTYSNGDLTLINSDGSNIIISGLTDDWDSTMSVSSIANTSTDWEYYRDNKPRFIVNSATTKIFESLDISTENTYGFLKTYTNTSNIEAPLYTVDDSGSTNVGNYVRATPFSGLYPPRVDSSIIGPGSFVSGFLNTGSGYSSLVFGGYSTASGSYSSSVGENNTSAGFASQAIGFEANANGDYSFAKGYYVDATYFTSMAMGGFVKSNSTSSLALGNGYSNNGGVNSATRWLIAGGQGSTNISTVNASYPSNGVGASATRSHIYGGINNQITSQSTGSMIIGGIGTILSGSSVNSLLIGLSGVTLNNFSNKVILRNLNIYETPLTNNTLNKVLGYNQSTKAVELVDYSSVTITGLSFNNGSYVLTIGNSDGSTYNTNLSILSSDMVVTGGTYNSSNGIATFTNNSGETFNVNGFLSGYTDIYLTGGTLGSGNTLNLINSDNSQINISLSGLADVDTYWVSGSTGLYSLKTINGSGLDAYGDYSIAMGQNTISSGVASHSEGYYNSSIGDYSHSEGSYTVSLGVGSHAEGNRTTTSGESSHSEGSYTTAIGYASHVEGYNTNSVGDYSHSEGYDTLSIGITSHAEGNFTTSFGGASHSEGSSTIASGDSSHSEGYVTTAIGVASHSEGSYTIAVGDNSHTEGVSTIASGDGSHAEGLGTTATYKASHAEGDGTLSLNQGSHSEGFLTTAFGYASHSEGRSTTAIGYGSHSEGSSMFIIPELGVNVNTPPSTVIPGVSDNLMASGDGSHAEGYATIAIGTASHSEGVSTTAIGLSSSAGGWVTKAVGYYSKASGYYTVASGDTSFVHSKNSQVNGDRSVVIGGENITGDSVDTVYVPNLNINYIPASALTNYNVLVRDNVSGDVKVLENFTPSSIGKFADDITFTGSVSSTITHNLNGLDVQVQLKNSSGVMIIPDIVNNYTSNSVDIEVSVSGVYRVIIIG